MNTNTLHIFGSDHGEGKDKTEKVQESTFEQKLDNAIVEYFERGLEVSSASKRKRTSAQKHLDAAEMQIRILILQEGQKLKNDDEKKKITQLVQAKIDGLALASTVNMNRGQFRRKFVATVEGVTGGTAEAVAGAASEAVEGAKDPSLKLVGNLAEILIGTLAELLKGGWRGLKRIAA